MLGGASSAERAVSSVGMSPSATIDTDSVGCVACAITSLGGGRELRRRDGFAVIDGDGGGGRFVGMRDSAREVRRRSVMTGPYHSG